MITSTMLVESGTPIEFTEEEKIFLYPDESNHFLFIPIPTLQENIKDNTKILEILSNKNKILMSHMIGPFHIILENIFTILEFYKQIENFQIIFDKFESNHRTDFNIFLPYIEKMCNRLSIDFLIIDSSEYDGIKINNFVVSSHNFISIDEKNFKENLKEIIFEEQQYDNKKIYLSRSKSYGGSRIKQEKDLEFFLKNEFGFETVYPEDFENFEQQISFFAKASCLVSATNSGLINQIFMKPGSTVLEIQTAFTQGHPNNSDKIIQSLHHQYNYLAYLMDHIYISIKNNREDLDDVIKKIKFVLGGLIA